MYPFLIRLFLFLLVITKAVLKSKDNLVSENLALRQQLTTYHIKMKQPRFSNIDRLFWVALKQVWERWRDHLIIVKPETVINWQRKRFKNHWGAPRIYSELLMLGFNDVSEATVSRYLRTFKSRHPDLKKQQSWMTFLKNHSDVISAMDFFIVPTIGFKILFVFFIIDHKRRIIRHFNVTSHPSALWVIQQLRDTFPFDKVPKYLILDRDKIFSSGVKGFLEHQLRVKPKVTSYRSPWQNGLAERFVLSARSDLLNHVIIFGEDHLRRLMKKYINYYNGDRCHLSVGRDSPLSRDIQQKPFESCKVKSIPKLGGLQHKYEWKQVA